MPKQLEMTTRGEVSLLQCLRFAELCANDSDVFFTQKITDNLQITISSRTPHVFTTSENSAFLIFL
jgi:hypothetical protein